MISSILFIIKSLFVKNIQTKYQIVSYIAIFISAILESFFPIYNFESIPLSDNINLLVAIFSITFLLHIFRQTGYRIEDQKKVILFILFAFPWYYIILFCLFWFLYISFKTNERIFLLIFTALLGFSSLTYSRVEYILLLGSIFSCIQKDSVEDYAIKSYLAYFILERVESLYITNVVIFLVLIRGLFILVKMMDCNDFMLFAKRFFSCVILVGFTCEIITQINIFQNLLLSIILLNTFLDSIVGKYLVVSPKTGIALTSMRSLFGHRDLTLLFALMVLFAPFNPIFNNIIFYFSQTSLFNVRLLVALAFFIILLFSVIFKTTFLVRNAPILENNLRDLYQFFILPLPSILAIFLMPKEIFWNEENRTIFGYSYFIYFSFFSLIYLVFLVISIYFDDKRQRWRFLDYFLTSFKIQALDNFLQQICTRPFSNAAHLSHLFQVVIFKTIKICCNSVLIGYNYRDNRESKIPPSIEIGVFFIILVLVAIYYEYNRI